MTDEDKKAGQDEVDQPQIGEQAEDKVKPKPIDGMFSAGYGGNYTYLWNNARNQRNPKG